MLCKRLSEFRHNLIVIVVTCRTLCATILISFFYCLCPLHDLTPGTRERTSQALMSPATATLGRPWFGLCGLCGLFLGLGLLLAAFYFLEAIV